MEVDLVVTLEPWTIEITYSIRILFGIVDGSSEVEGAAPIIAITLAKATTHFGGIVDPTFFDTKTKDEQANLMVESGMEGGNLLLIQLKSSIVLIATTLSFIVATKDLGVDGRFEET